MGDPGDRQIALAQHLARRLTIAEELLIESECNLEEIALRSSFGRSAYLIEHFQARLFAAQFPGAGANRHCRRTRTWRSGPAGAPPPGGATADAERAAREMAA